MTPNINIKSGTPTIIGIDPGVGGAIAILLPEEKKAYLIRLTWAGQVGHAPLLNSTRLHNILVKLKIDLVSAIFVCEDVHVFANDGKKSISKFMAATSAVINTLDTLRQSSESGYRRYKKPDYWRVVSPQKWRSIIRSACSESGIAPGTTKSSSVRWYQKLSHDWKVFQVSSHSNDRAAMPVIEVAPTVTEDIRMRVKVDCREAFLIAYSAIE